MSGRRGRWTEVVITGGVGFIGSALARALVGEGVRVRVVDEARGSGLTCGPNLEFAQASVLDRDALSPLIDGSLVFHLASVVGVKRVLADPEHAYRVAHLGSQNVLELCARKSIPIVLFSSSEVYGPDRQDQLSEADGEEPLPSGDARFAYALGKLMAERHARALADRHGLRVIVVRPFNVAGPGQEPDSGMVLARFCRWALRGEPLRVHGDGRQTRCFLHVMDAVEMSLALASCEAAFGQTVNIGSEEEVTIEELAERTIALSGSHSPIVKVDYASEFPSSHRDFRRRRPNLTKVRALIGDRSLRCLDQIILDTLASLRASSTGLASLVSR